MKKFLTFLILDNNDKISHTKFWSNIAYGVATWAFVYSVLKNNAPVDLWLVYLGVVSGHTALSKYLSKSDKLPEVNK